MIIFPNAKINIGLHITEKLTDGYHAIETIFYPVKLADMLEFVENKESNKTTLEISGLNLSGTVTNNLVLKAYNLLAQYHTIPPLKIHLHKIIPAGAGLGGGSADAAFFLNLLNDYYNLKIKMFI